MQVIYYTHEQQKIRMRGSRETQLKRIEIA